MARPIAISGLILLLVGLSLSPAVAGEKNWDETRIVSDKFNVTLGGALTDFRTDVGVGTGTLIGTTIRLENDLNIDDNQSSFRLGGFWRFKPKHQLAFGFVSFKRSGLTEIDEEIEFEDVIFINGELASEFDVQLLALTYRYSFVNNGRTEAGFTAGVSFYDFFIALDGEIEVSNGNKQLVSEDARADEGFIAPIPTVGLYLHHGFTPNLIFGMHASFLNLDISDYLIRVVDSGLNLDWFFSKHVGIGVGVSTSDIQFESSGGETNFRVAYRQSAFSGYLTFGF